MFCQSLAHEKSRDALNPADTTILEAQSDRIYMTRGLLPSWSAFFLIKKKGKKDIFIPFIRPPCNIHSSPPKETLPQSSTHSISFKYWGSEYWHFVDNYSNSPPVRQFSWVWDWDVLVWPVNPDWNYKLSNKMLQFAFTAVSYSLLW